MFKLWVGLVLTNCQNALCTFVEWKSLGENKIVAKLVVFYANGASVLNLNDDGANGH